jgi:hypothetical protein
MAKLLFQALNINRCADSLHAVCASEYVGCFGGYSKTIWVDCNDASRESRLRINRRQPEPANARIMNWARFLRNEADASSILKLDTTRSSIEECVFELLAVFDL